MKALDVMKKKRLEQSREVREQEGHLQRARDHRNKAEQVRCPHHLRAVLG